MMRTKNILLIILLVFILTNLVYSQKKNNSKDGIYQKEMKSLRSAIQKNLYDKASGNYILITDTSKRERKDGYQREYTYLWSLCALFEVANEIEKVDLTTKMLDPLIVNMNKY